MSIQFRVRDFRYPISIVLLRLLFERSQSWSIEDHAEYQRRLLRCVITQAYHQVPYYQDLFRTLRLRPADIRTIRDLQKLPLLPKATVRTHFHQLQAKNKNLYHARMYQTSGTSGAPVRFLLDKPANVLEFVHYWSHWSWAGYRLGKRFAELTSHYFLQNDELAKQPWRSQRSFGRLLLNSLSLCPDGVEELARALRRHRPSFLKGLASPLYFFALFLKEKKIEDITLRGVFSTGEVLLSSQRKLIEEVFHTKVYDSYGHMERTVAISECPSGRLHINPEYGVLELVDHSPLSVASDCGYRSVNVCAARVVGTSLHNRSMPLLRYEVGDLVEVEEPSPQCSCGRSMPSVRRIIGRQEDVVTTPDGRVISSLFIVFNQVAGISLGQVVQEAPDRLSVRVVPSSAYTSQSESDLYGYLRRFLGPAMHVDVEYMSAEALRRRTVGKFRTIISAVPAPYAAVIQTNQRT